MVDKSRSVTTSDATWDPGQGPHRRQSASSASLQHERSPSRLLGVRLVQGLAAARCDRRFGRTRRQIPSLEAEFQMVERWRRGQDGTRTSRSGRTPTTAPAPPGRMSSIAPASRDPWASCVAVTRVGSSTSTMTGVSGSAVSAARLDAAAVDISKRRLPGRPGWLSSRHPQLPHVALLQGQLVGDSATAAAQHLLGGERHALYTQSPAVEIHGRDCARQAGALGLSRSAALFAASRLVGQATPRSSPCSRKKTGPRAGPRSPPAA